MASVCRSIVLAFLERLVLVTCFWIFLLFVPVLALQ